MTPVIYSLIRSCAILNGMGGLQNVSIEPGLLKIFRLFSLAVSLFFFLFYGFPIPVYELIGPYRQMLAFMGLSYGCLFAYLTIPNLRKILKKFFLPIAILASIFIPVGFINWGPQTTDIAEHMGQPVQPINSWTVTILLLFPLVITAWQYSFNMVLIFFAVLGFIDPLISIFIYEQGSEGLHMIIYASAVRITAFTAVGYIITELMKNQRQRREELARANEKLQEYARQIRELAVIRERNRLASELHDVLAHTLSGLTVHLEAIDSTIPHDAKELHREMNRAIESARGGLKETRRVLQDLRAEPLESYGFTQAVTQLIEQYAQRGELKITSRISPDLPELPSAVEQNIYRITQECLENILQHSRASHAEIWLSTADEGRLFLLTVEDDGAGFVPEEVDQQKHFGIATIRDRAQRLGGTAEITSPVPGRTQGTQIQIRIPREKRYDSAYHM